MPITPTHHIANTITAATQCCSRHLPNPLPYPLSATLRRCMSRAAVMSEYAHGSPNTKSTSGSGC